MKAIVTALALFNLIACGTDSKDSGANLVAAETETTTTDETATDKTKSSTETTTTETDTMDPDAYPIAEGFTKIAVSSFEPDGPSMGFKMEFIVDFQCTGGVEIRGESIGGGYIHSTSYVLDSQPASWVSGFKFTQTKAFSMKADYATGYNLQSRVLYKCL